MESIQEQLTHINRPTPRSRSAERRLHAAVFHRIVEDVTVMPLDGCAGAYYPRTRRIRIDPSVTRPVYAMLHELGHAVDAFVDRELTACVDGDPGRNPRESAADMYAFACDPSLVADDPVVVIGLANLLTVRGLPPDLIPSVPSSDEE